MCNNVHTWQICLQIQYKTFLRISNNNISNAMKYKTTSGKFN